MVERAPSGQALAVPAGPVARPSPSGIDPSRWLILTEHNFAIRFAVREYCMDFRVFDCAEAFSLGSDVGVWELWDGCNGFPLDAWEQADWQIDGSLKWDGCINWQTNPECMMHGCGPRTAHAISDVFSAIYAYGKRHFDMLGDEPPPMPAGTIEVSDAIAMETRRAETEDTGSVAKP